MQTKISGGEWRATQLMNASPSKLSGDRLPTDAPTASLCDLIEQRGQQARIRHPRRTQSDRRAWQSCQGILELPGQNDQIHPGAGQCLPIGDSAFRRIPFSGHQSGQSTFLHSAVSISALNVDEGAIVHVERHEFARLHQTRSPGRSAGRFPSHPSHGHFPFPNLASHTPDRSRIRRTSGLWNTYRAGFIESTR